MLSAEGSLAAQLKVKQVHAEVGCPEVFFAVVGLVSQLELKWVLISCVPGCFVPVSPLQDAGAVMGTAWERFSVCCTGVPLLGLL